MIQKEITLEQEGQFSYQGLDNLLLEKARLAIMTALLAYPQGLLFSDVKRLCKLTDGNLSRHIQILSEKGFVEVWKGYLKKRPQTYCRLSDKGRKSFTAYLEELWRTTHAAREKGAHARESSSQYESFPPGWVLVR
jgi:DNA-binding MarR family transcriptional regulator